MAVRDYTGEFLNTLKFFQPNVRPIDFSGVIDSYQGAYDKAHNKMLSQNLADALESGDENAIRQARAALDPTGYADLLEKQAQRAEDRKWEEEKLQRSYDFQEKLADKNFANQLRLLQTKNSLGGGLTSKQKDLQFLMANGIPQKEAMAIAFGGGTEALGGMLSDSLQQNDYGLTGDALKTYSKEKAKNIVKAEDAFNSAVALGENTRGTTENIRSLLRENPTVAGAYSGWNEQFKKYVKDDPEWMKARGQLVTELTQAGNFLIKQANDSGVTGINSLPEVERIIKGLSTDSSPEQIKGALDAVDKLSYDLEYKTRNILNSYKKKGSLKDFNAQPKTIQAGFESDGYIFKGGDPNDESNWEKK